MRKNAFFKMAGSTLYFYETINKTLSGQERPDFNLIPEKMMHSTENTLKKKNPLSTISGD